MIRRPIATPAALAVLSSLLASGALAQGAPGGAAAGGGAPQVPVATTKVQRQDLPVLLSGLGLVVANKSIVIHPRVDGTVDQVAFQEGQLVKAGDLLVQLDPRPYQAILDQVVAKRASDAANLANARNDLARYTQLASNQFAAQQQVDSQRATVAQLEAAVRGDEANIAAAQLNVEFCRITAPFDGRVGLRLTDPGAFVRSADNTQAGLVNLSQISPISMTFALPQDQLPRVMAAMRAAPAKVYATTPDGSGRLAEGTVVTVDNAIDTTTGTIKVKATFPNTDNKLWPGQFVNASAQVDVIKDAITVPTPVIQHGPVGLFVFVVKPDSTVAVQPVEVSYENGKVSVVSKGLEQDQVVVLNGQSRLVNGTHVIATPGA